VASVGLSLANELGLAPKALAADATDDGPDQSGALAFGDLEPLVCHMQETPIARLLPSLVEKLNAGTEIRTLLAAAALANARTFGGEDYVGFHTLMAMMPALHMSGEMPDAQRALPAFKVLYRNTNRIQEHGGRKGEVLQPIDAPAPLPEGVTGADALRDAIHKQDTATAERLLLAIAQRSPEDAFNDLLMTVQERPEVHRVVLPYRAWDLLSVIGKEHAHTMLRQSVRYCVRAENNRGNPEMEAAKAVLPKMLEKHGLLGKAPGDRAADDAWIDSMSQTIFRSTPEQAADAAAAALAEGIRPADVGEAVSLAANQLVLRDSGRSPLIESPGKPIGSVHGDSVGVHACDTANAWRNMARVTNTRNTFACLILGAYEVAQDRIWSRGDFLNWEAVPFANHLNYVTSTDPAKLLADCEEAIRGNLQARASAAVHKYGQLGHDPRGVLDLMLRYATSEDGALHAEKYYRTCSEEFANTRPAFRWRQLTALARVTASEFGRPAPGYAEAKALLKV
jgi:hypothetical protein